jgi:hypothetical protein
MGDSAELAAEIEQVLRVLGADGPQGSRRPHVVATTVLLVAMLGGVQHSATLRAEPDGDQTPSAEALYEAGALRTAADSFAARAAQEPRDPAHWFNLGATLYRAGADGKATVAWTLAARLAPRDAAIGRARGLLPPPDLMTDKLLRVGWATPAEWSIIGGVAWIALWLAVAIGAHRRRPILIVFGGATLAAVVLGVIEQRRRDLPTAVVVGEAVPVRTAPYGGASAATTVAPGAALLVRRSYGSWREVRRGDGLHGWVLSSEIAPL